MRILICTPLYPPDIGGPANYAKNLSKEFSALGHDVTVLTYKVEKKIPTGIRHFVYFLRVILKIWKVDLVIALDTYSVGFPAVCAAKTFGKKIILRVGGDFLWENYVEKTGCMITLKKFCNNLPKLSSKHKVVFNLSRWLMRNATGVVFSTEWQKNIFKNLYNLNESCLFVIENYYGKKLGNVEPKTKNFLWAGRRLKLKNLEMLEQSFELAQRENKEIKLEISEHVSRNELMEKIKSCYAIILPSLSEVSPNFILEAVKFNKPFIVTQEMGLRERLKDIGVFVDPLDKEDIKKKILFLAGNENYEKQKEKIENFNFTRSWHQIADEFLNIYKK